MFRRNALKPKQLSFDGLGFLGRGKAGGFTLVELLVVIGIIALLISILIPALSGAQRRARTLACQSNLRQVGIALIAYAQENNGHIVPQGVIKAAVVNAQGQTVTPAVIGLIGGAVTSEKRWPTKVFRMPPMPDPSNPPLDWNPPVLLCPSDPDAVRQHSYIFNGNLVQEEDQSGNVSYAKDPIRFGRTRGAKSTDIILMGEKKSDYADYHMNPKQYDVIVEQFRHGLYVGSNYLFMDGHVASALPKVAKMGLDPWNPESNTTTTPPTTPPTNP